MDNWTSDLKRRDGLEIVMGIGGWIIRLPRGGGLMRSCPCCDRPFSTMRSARMVADHQFPLPTLEVVSDSDDEGPEAA